MIQGQEAFELLQGRVLELERKVHNLRTRRTLRTARALQSILRLQGEMKSALEDRIKDLLALVEELRQDCGTVKEKLGR